MANTEYLGQSTPLDPRAAARAPKHERARRRHPLGHTQRRHYDGPVSASHIRVLGLAGSLSYAFFIAWLYATGPASMAEVTGGVAAGFNAYRADEQSFQEGLALFQQDNFLAARVGGIEFERIDQPGTA